MRVSSKEIKYLLDKGLLKITGNSQHPFDPQKQIRPGSIDVRISNKFYKFKNEIFDQLDIIDLTQAKTIGETPELLYEKIELTEESYINLEPKEIVLTETLEYIEIPNFISASLKGRSSFARLGISIHCTGDYINPGYHGFMPIQIINNSPITVKIYPYLSMAQLVFYFLSSAPDIDYQSLPDTIYNSERSNTEGLSLWFRDKEIERLAIRVSGHRFSQEAEDIIKALINKSERRVIKQIESYLKQQNNKNPGQIEQALTNYESKDVTRDKKMSIIFWVNSLFLGADISIFIPSLIQVISNSDFQNSTFWISLLCLLFSTVILWITFDYRYIGL